MTDRMILRVSDDWAIFADKNQWIVSKARKRGVGIDWRAKAYVASNKTQLLSTLFKMAVQISSEAEVELSRWPEGFLEWRLKHKGK